MVLDQRFSLSALAPSLLVETTQAISGPFAYFILSFAAW
jgi:hypothetical protein